jgi:hypothetical protein
MKVKTIDTGRRALTQAIEARQAAERGLEKAHKATQAAREHQGAVDAEVEAAREADQKAKAGHAAVLAEAFKSGRTAPAEATSRVLGDQQGATRQ